MSHDLQWEAKFLAGLAEIDAEYAAKVREAGCTHCEDGKLDSANYPRKARGDLGEAATAFEKRLSFCCREDGCRRRSTPPSLRFLGRKVYVAVVVIAASIVGRGAHLGRGARAALGVPARTVRRWLSWWQTVFALSAFFVEAKGYLATPPAVADLPGSLLSHFGTGTVALEKMLRLLGPITTTSMRARIAMGA